MVSDRETCDPRSLFVSVRLSESRPKPSSVAWVRLLPPEARNIVGIVSYHLGHGGGSSWSVSVETLVERVFSVFVYPKRGKLTTSCSASIG